jgi:hypothetical protein
MKIRLLLLIIILIFFSCNNDNQSKKEKAEKQFKKEQKNYIISELNRKYDITAYCDTLFYLNYTIEFQEKYQDKLLLLNDFSIHDVYIESEDYHLIIEPIWPELNLDLLINKNDYNLLQIDKSKLVNYITDVLMVFKIHELKKNRLDDILIGEGEIIEILKIKTNPFDF